MLALSLVLAGLEVCRVAVLEDSRDAVIALLATCAFLPLHAWHLRYGLRGARPPHAGWTLALVAAIQAVALALIGPSWAPMLAALATSALIVLRPPWALAALAAFLCPRVKQSGATDARRDFPKSRRGDSNPGPLHYE